MPSGESEGKPDDVAFRPRVIIAGFGLPGRSIADSLEIAHIPYSVIEVNADVVDRCLHIGRHMIRGDVRDPAILREAGIETADILALMVPVEAIVLDAIDIARSLRKDIKIIARTSFTSTGMDADKRGADRVIVAEQVVAAAAANVVKEMIKTLPVLH